jgi:hypothetical protein
MFGPGFGPSNRPAAKLPNRGWNGQYNVKPPTPPNLPVTRPTARTTPAPGASPVRPLLVVRETETPQGTASNGAWKAIVGLAGAALVGYLGLLLLAG